MIESVSYRLTYQSEVDRWKDLANERLAKMEQLSSQLEERHCHEVSLYRIYQIKLYFKPGSSD